MVEIKSSNTTKIKVPLTNLKRLMLNNVTTEN